MKRINWVLCFAAGSALSAAVGWTSWRTFLEVTAMALVGAFLLGGAKELGVWIRALRSRPSGTVCDYCGERATPEAPVTLEESIGRRLHRRCLDEVDPSGRGRGLRLATDVATSTSEST